eukprot:2143495-Lingulodinium_polyedra.AAC.1
MAQTPKHTPDNDRAKFNLRARGLDFARRRPDSRTPSPPRPTTAQHLVPRASGDPQLHTPSVVIHTTLLRTFALHSSPSVPRALCVLI